MSAFQPVDTFQPLAGLRVLDFSHVIAGPFATFLLAQLGAQVTKVEGAGGDVMRRTERGRQGFVALNAGKDHLTLDLATDEGRRHAVALAATCDVVPGVLERFGLGYEAVRAQHPGVIYCSISGFGRGAPAWQQRSAYDHVVQAITGMAWLGGQEGDPPLKTGFPVVDAATGMLAALAVLAALRERDRTGSGMLVDVSMVGAGLQLMYPMACDALTSGSTPPRVGNQGYSGSPAADFFPTRDGWLAIGANTPRQLSGWCERFAHVGAVTRVCLCRLAEVRHLTVAAPLCIALHWAIDDRHHFGRPWLPKALPED